MPSTEEEVLDGFVGGEEAEPFLSPGFVYTTEVPGDLRILQFASWRWLAPRPPARDIFGVCVNPQ